MDMERELGVYARIRSMIDQEEITEEVVRERWANYTALTHEIVVAERDGQLLGMARWGRMYYEPEGLYQISVGVFPEFRRQGVGRALARHVMDSRIAAGANKLMGGCYAQFPENELFAREMGFSFKMRYVDQEVELPSSITVPLPDGIEVEVFQAASPDDARLQEIYDTYAEADSDEPLTRETGVPSREVWTNYWKLADYNEGLIVVARENGVPVGLCHSVRRQDHFDTGFTGTRRAVRGRGIAKALKVRLMQEEANRGTSKMATCNSSLNQAMLAINRTVGFHITSEFDIWEQMVPNSQS
ncbi:MAG: GNAT family N-acetyltransferase [Chthonomonas sp.]|nr:GNAT family N-acetyltransferase [Chthonomonas sp.]